MVGKNEIKSPPPSKGIKEALMKDEKKNDIREDRREQNHGQGAQRGRGGFRGGHAGRERSGEFERGGEGVNRGEGAGGGGRGRGRGRGGFQSRERGDGQRQGGGGGGGGGGRGEGRGEGRGGGHSSYNADQPQISMEDAMPAADKKFTGRCRLFCGNMPTDTTEEEFKAMFKEHGEFTECFLNAARGFGFIRLDTKANAEAAKKALDGQVIKNRTLRVRCAAHGAALRVKYLPSHVTNELLAQAFSIFGELERSVIIVDDRGKPSGEGIVEFSRKPGAQAALKRISEGVFMMGAQPRPITVEPLEQKDEEDGYPEKFIMKSGDIMREREQPPRFAGPGSFEFDFGNKWKELFMMHEEQQKNLKRQFEEAVAKLEIEQAGAMMEHHTNMLRQDLLRRQEELRRLEEMHQMELQKRMERIQRGFDDSRGGARPEEDRRMLIDEDRRGEMNMRRQQQEERRQQELYAQQERAMRELQGDGEGRGNAPPMQPPPAPPAGMGLERGRGKGNHQNQSSSGNQGSNQQSGFNEGQQPLRQSRFDQPPGFNQGQGNGNHASNMGGGMSLMGRGQQEPIMQERPMQGGRQMQQERQERGDRNMRDEFYEAKRARRF